MKSAIFLSLLLASVQAAAVSYDSAVNEKSGQKRIFSWITLPV